MKKLGEDLIFISRIDGNGHINYPCRIERDKIRDSKKFEINCLSLSNRTFIASGFESYVVRLRKKDKKL